MDKIFWVDLEMTGLSPYTSVIVEFAGIITDLKLEPLAQFHEVVYQPPEELAKMNDWVRTTHGDSGLLDEIPNGKPLAKVETAVLDFLRPHFGEERPILAGNSIHQDRKFIDRYMKDLAEYLHYRMIDVSSFKQVFRHIYHINLEKHTPHRAYDDIMASIEELKHYMQYIHVPQDEAKTS